VEPSNQLTSMTNQASSAEFYTQAPFHNSQFILITCVFTLDLAFCAFALLESWRHSNLQVAICMAFVIMFLVGTWRLGFRTYEQIRILFETGQIGKVEKGSALDKLLGTTTSIMMSGLFSTFILAGFCLAALAKMLPSR
jgi:hypothetical protein